VKEKNVFWSTRVIVNQAETP